MIIRSSLVRINSSFWPVILSIYTGEGFSVLPLPLGKSHALCRHAVDVWCFKILLAIAPKVAVAEIIGQDMNDVWGPYHLR